MATTPTTNQTVAFTPARMECLRDLLVEYKRNRSSPRS